MGSDFLNVITCSRSGYLQCLQGLMSLSVVTDKMSFQNISPLSYFILPSFLYNLTLYDRVLMLFHQAPAKLLREPYTHLLNYLLSGLHDDLSKVRAIYRWITSLKMERILLPKQEPPPTTPLYQIWRIKHRRGNYAQLVSILCK